MTKRHAVSQEAPMDPIGPLFTESEEERELLELFRRARDRPAVLEEVRKRVMGDRVLVHAQLRIQRLNQGRVRSFWTELDRPFIDFTFPNSSEGLADIRVTAEDFLHAFFTDRGLAPDGPVTYEIEEQRGGRWIGCYLRQGHHRVFLLGLPEWMERAWLRVNVAA